MWGAKRGKGVPIRDHGVDQRVFAPRGEHSEKPDEAYHALERLYGDVRRLELFGTKLRRGWTVWGHIAGSRFVTRLRERGLL
jgi:N6-adenosine-specific RNA methylase IME4